ncbi:MAG: hypothetical protein BZ136_07540 [Methanosphaera sp. rholeuAM74]|nr:MAG: hypothetical protein BZ136_07540 [Methanosphaera sp. rholeuAM74]
MSEEIVGTDIDYGWRLTPEGDINTVGGQDNLSQAVYLRLSCFLDDLDYCYSNYGSTTKEWLGKNQNPYTRETLIDEIETRVELDPRIDKCTAQLKDWSHETIGVYIRATVIDGSDFEDFFIFSNITRSNDEIHNPMYKDTHIDTHRVYYAVQGENLTVKAVVLDTDEQRVPVGLVSLHIGGYYVECLETDSNPCMIEQSGSEDPGSVTFTFKVPEFIALGDHELIFRYKGIYGYNSSVTSTVLKVVERLPTQTNFVYKDERYPYYYANDVDVFTDPVVYVSDYNDAPVRMGKVEYYIDTDDVYGERFVIDSPLIFLNDELLDDRVIIRTTEDILSYSSKFIFKLVPRHFHNKDRFPLYSSDGELIDVLECIYTEGIYFLQTTESDVNCSIKLWVIE